MNDTTIELTLKSLLDRVENLEIMLYDTRGQLDKAKAKIKELESQIK